MDVVDAVKRVHGGNIARKVQEEPLKNGKVLLACYKCWIRSTKKKDYEYEDGRVSRLFRNMAQRTKNGASDLKRRQWMKWRVEGKLKPEQ
eukprot:3871858-Amphidinium_carterae.1